ncbi:cupin domain-containing protein [Nocardioides marmoribigeumensis]|uniref:Quercetin dioxygenase-like cupin family protein n=1 Tax=Nocardioides marmoribigeumensis TaxID=433649 RepID=A0ABU2BVH1_9ACTN|nr:cupin domain-containing protein [Nocardioides marmoribigeumensis]MDR7362625.1 quercetin dioxygenase-like cupin family protein [Nocardioides marmoribigeumensis]
METTSLTALSDQHLQNARASSTGRSAATVYGGQQHDLRQTLVAMRAGTVLGEHQAPGEATLQVLQGRVTLRAGEESWTLGAGDLGAIPAVRHDLAADEDAVVLLTVATDRTAARANQDV